MCDDEILIMFLGGAYGEINFHIINKDHVLRLKSVSGKF